jgi:signal transduction histidine kinase
MVAHSIRTSAGGISVLTELLARTSLDARQRRYVKGVLEHGQDVEGKIPLLDISAAKGAPGSVQEVPFSPRTLIEDVTSLLRPLADSKGLDLRVEIQPEIPSTIKGDVRKVRHVLVSVIHNAIRFTRVGVVTVRCCHIRPGDVAFEVQDSGPGIPANVRRRVSAGFVRADGTAWHRNHGPQIGLSISKRLVDSMGGQFVLESELSRGTTVRVVLPMQGRNSFFITGSPISSKSGVPDRQEPESQTP